MKKIFALLMATVLAAGCLVSCGGDKKGNDEDTGNKAKPFVESSFDPVAKEDIKVGFIFLHDENSTYDKNFLDAAKAAQKSLGLRDDQVIYKVNVPESNDCYEAAADLADAGCDVIFADSFGHESFIKQAAVEFPDVRFCHATGTTGHSSGIGNFYNAFANIYEGRYLVGVAAGLKLNEMIDSGKITADQAKMGYVGAFPYAEVKSGYTSFYLGAKSVCPTVTMDVKFTTSWFDIAKEKEAANALIEGGCVLISQHADSEGAPKACEAAGVPNVAYNLDTRDWGPNTALVSSKINWQPYFEHIITAAIEGKPIGQDFCKGLADGVVQILGLNETVAAEGTQEKLEEVKEKLISGKIKVFDTETFTVGGKKLTEYKADVIDDGTFSPDTNVVSNGYFHESEYRSAPYFDIDIDGITIK